MRSAEYVYNTLACARPPGDAGIAFGELSAMVEPSLLVATVPSAGGR
jgi:hypothetical protein